MSEFFQVFVAALIGAAVGFGLRSRSPAERPCLKATILQVVALALGMALPQVAFQFFPQLGHGWIRYVTVVIFVWIIYLPASWWAGRMRKASS
jgi:hypothetical protein